MSTNDDLPPLLVPYKPPNRSTCAACGTPGEPMTISAGNMVSPPMIFFGCKKCGNATMIVQIGGDEPIAQYTAAQTRAYAREAVAAATERCAQRLNDRADELRTKSELPHIRTSIGAWNTLHRLAECTDDCASFLRRETIQMEKQ